MTITELRPQPGLISGVRLSKMRTAPSRKCRMATTRRTAGSLRALESAPKPGLAKDFVTLRKSRGGTLPIGGLVPPAVTVGRGWNVAENAARTHHKLWSSRPLHVACQFLASCRNAVSPSTLAPPGSIYINLRVCLKKPAVRTVLRGPAKPAGWLQSSPRDRRSRARPRGWSPSGQRTRR
jgi:hypothetical protein